jgi:hypothetical protein
MKKVFFCISLFVIATISGKAQTNSGTDSFIIGTWKGTSICQVKNSPCHDEIVVYHISKVEGIDTFRITANKIVNGVEEDMGILECKLDRKRNQLISATNKATWTFNITGKSINGILMVQGNLYRIVKVKKQE